MQNRDSKNESDQDAKPAETPRDDGNEENQFCPTMTGTLQSFADRGRPVSGRIVTQPWQEHWDSSCEDEVTAVMTAADVGLRRAGGFQGRGGRGGGVAVVAGGPGRRRFYPGSDREVAQIWDERHWEESPLLKPDNRGTTLLAELKQLRLEKL